MAKIKNARPKKQLVRVWCIGPDQTEYYAARSRQELVAMYIKMVGKEQQEEDFKDHCEEVPQSAFDQPFDFDEDGKVVKTTWLKQIEKNREYLPCQISTGYN